MINDKIDISPEYQAAVEAHTDAYLRFVEAHQAYLSGGMTDAQFEHARAIKSEADAAFDKAVTIEQKRMRAEIKELKARAKKSDKLAQTMARLF